VSHIPFNRPAIAGKELDYIREAIQRGQLAGDGYFTHQCQLWLKGYFGCPGALLTHSCTAALEMAAILVNIQPGDEVVMPSFTFVSTANAVVLRGGVPVFVDIRADTLNIDEEAIDEAITPRTRAIFVVHYAGVPAEMEAIAAIARRKDLKIVEDAAQALGSSYHGQKAGTIGSLATFSFHETKNLISGEGGALIINDPELVEQAEIIWEKGTNRKRFFRGQVDKYSWVEVGSSFLPGELVASFLFGQLEKAEAIQRDRMASWQAYDRVMSSFSNRGLQTPSIPERCKHNAHLYYIILPTAELRGEFIERMKADGIVTPFHYVPLHSAPAGRRYARTCGELKRTEDISERLVRMPMFSRMDDELPRILDRAHSHLDRLL
jgi:dTDP-4-amino-4,6-dideoxygalactose transaminase